MSETQELTGALANLKSAMTVAAEASQKTPVYEVKRDTLGRAYATGRRKDAIARVWIKPGKGEGACSAACLIPAQLRDSCLISCVISPCSAA